MSLALARFLLELDRKMDLLLSKQEILMASVATLQTEMAELTTKVQGLTDVTTSAITLLQGLSAIIASLRQQLIDAQQAGAEIPQTVIDQLDALEATLETKKASLAAAIVANTPAA